jgi:Chromo (CHRromatin Organisation MOdifier) domain
MHPTFNIEKLKRYRDGRAAFPDRPQPHPRPPPIASADSNGDQLWEVEKVVAKRKHGRGTQFLVVWKGYPAEENTWEPRQSLLPGAAEALAEFESHQ